MSTTDSHGRLFPVKDIWIIKNISKMKRTVICEYVGLGHPDKVADQISDALLDAFLDKDPDTRAGIEVMVKDNIVVLGG